MQVLHLLYLFVIFAIRCKDQLNFGQKEHSTFKQTNLLKCKEVNVLRHDQKPMTAKGLVCLRKLRQNDCTYKSARSLYCYVHFPLQLDTINVLKQAGNIIAMMANKPFPCVSHFLLGMIAVSSCISCYRNICHCLEARKHETTKGLDQVWHTLMPSGFQSYFMKPSENCFQHLKWWLDLLFLTLCWAGRERSGFSSRSLLRKCFGVISDQLIYDC